MIGYWMELKGAGVPIGLSELIGMTLRGTLSRELVSAMVVAQKVGLEVDRTMLEAHALAGGSVREVLQAAVTLEQVGESVPIESLFAVDLARSQTLALVNAYLPARERHPELRFDEVLERFLLGEDVIAAAGQGELFPLVARSGWAVRIEYGPLSAAAVREIADKAVTAARYPTECPS